VNPITFPLQPGMQGSAVADLQDALLLLIERQVIKTFPAPNRPTVEELQALAQRLKQERTQSTFGDATRELIRYFQIQQGLGDQLAGVVEAKIVAALRGYSAGVLRSSFPGACIALSALTSAGCAYKWSTTRMSVTVLAGDLRTMASASPHETIFQTRR
jgi:hypothetical protein